MQFISSWPPGKRGRRRNFPAYYSGPRPLKIRRSALYQKLTTIRRLTRRRATAELFRQPLRPSGRSSRRVKADVLHRKLRNTYAGGVQPQGREPGKSGRMFGRSGRLRGQDTLMKTRRRCSNLIGLRSRCTGPETCSRQGRGAQAARLPAAGVRLTTAYRRADARLFASLKGVADGGSCARWSGSARTRQLSAAAGRRGGFSVGSASGSSFQAIICRPRRHRDEATAGLEPRALPLPQPPRYRGRGYVVILSTHIVSDVSNLCGRMAIIRRGEINAPARRARRSAQFRRVWEAAVEREQVRPQVALRVISSQVVEGRVRVRFYAHGGRLSSIQPRAAFARRLLFQVSPGRGLWVVGVLVEEFREHAFARSLTSAAHSKRVAHYFIALRSPQRGSGGPKSGRHNAGRHIDFSSSESSPFLLMTLRSSPALLMAPSVRVSALGVSRDHFSNRWPRRVLSEVPGNFSCSSVQSAFALRSSWSRLSPPGVEWPRLACSYS